MPIRFSSSVMQPGYSRRSSFLEAQARILSNSSSLYASQLNLKRDERLRIGHPYSSPLRVDRNPSFEIFFSTVDKKLLWHDFATGESGDVIKFYSILWKCTYNQALERLTNGDYHVPERIETGVGVYSRHKKIIQKLQVVPTNWTDESLEYWAKYGIDRDILDKYNVTPLAGWYIDGHLMYKGSFPKDPLYAWRIFSSIKIYAPKGGQSRKWRCTCSSTDIQGWEQLSKGTSHEISGVFFITKALKDVMVLRKMGYAAIAPQSEVCNMPSVVMEEIDKKYGMTRIFVFFDNDTAGQQGAYKLLRHRPNWFNMRLPIVDNKAKDISDFVVEHGFAQAKQWVQEKLRRYDAGLTE